MVVSKRKNWKETIFNVKLWFPFDGCWFHFYPNSAQPTPPPEPGAQREQLQTTLPWDLIQVTIASSATQCFHSFTQTPNIHSCACWQMIRNPSWGCSNWTSIDHNQATHNNKIEYLIIFQVIDSEVTKSSVHFSMSSFKRILLIFHPTCWIDLHY